MILGGIQMGIYPWIAVIGLIKDKSGGEPKTTRLLSPSSNPLMRNKCCRLVGS
jgi:hypothetical protein